jgi:hypothetical protein
MVGDEAVYHPTRGLHWFWLAPVSWACWPCPDKHKNILIMLLISWCMSAVIVGVSGLYYG